MLTALVVLAAAAAPAAEAAASVATFDVADKHFTIPAPAGYCRPTGDLAVFDAQIASADPGNATLASFYACGRKPATLPVWEYVYVKAPHSAAGLTVSKVDALAAFVEVFNRPDAPRFDQTMSDTISENYDQAMGLQVEVNGTWGYIGSDADCVYIGGTVVTKGKGKVMPINGATCLSAVGGKVIAVNVYADPKAAGIPELQRRARTIFLTIRPE